MSETQPKDCQTSASSAVPVCGSDVANKDKPQKGRKNKAAKPLASNQVQPEIPSGTEKTEREQLAEDFVKMRESAPFWPLPAASFSWLAQDENPAVKYVLKRQEQIAKTFDTHWKMASAAKLGNRIFPVGDESEKDFAALERDNPCIGMIPAVQKAVSLLYLQDLRVQYLNLIMGNIKIKDRVICFFTYAMLRVQGYKDEDIIDLDIEQTRLEKEGLFSHGKPSNNSGGYSENVSGQCTREIGATGGREVGGARVRDKPDPKASAKASEDSVPSA
jgi:hypothetical protein